MDTPASLIERLRLPGQEQAWARFVELYTPLLYRWARRAGCQEGDAADLVQEVLTLLVQKLPEFRYDQRKSFRSWLLTVARNCWINLRRKAELLREPGAANLDAVAAVEPPDLLSEEEYKRWLVSRALQLMRSEFQPSTWAACWECVANDRPAAEVAAELGLSVGAVYVAKSRVLSRLRQELQELLD